MVVVVVARVELNIYPVDTLPVPLGGAVGAHAKEVARVSVVNASR